MLSTLITYIYRRTTQQKLFCCKKKKCMNCVLGASHVVIWGATIIFSPYTQSLTLFVYLI